MEPPALILDRRFWDESRNTALLNPRMAGAPTREHALERGADAADLRGHVIVATSGSTGAPKFACLSRRALLDSAVAVNGHLQATAADRWLCALPLFHVGGLGIWARAHVLGSRVTPLTGRWNPRHFCARLAASRASLTALVPTQVHDLVAHGCACPPGVRAVLVGGGALSPELGASARALGWPLLETFGMTEAGSQVATRELEAANPNNVATPVPGLPVLPVWEVRLGAAAALEIRGTPLFSGYLVRRHARQCFAFECPVTRDGWFRTSDRVHLQPSAASLRLTPLQRSDSLVKILGENVDVGAIQAAIDPGCTQIVIVAIPDARAGARLVAAIDGAATADPQIVNSILRKYNATADPPERINAFTILARIPRNPLGKIPRQKLVEVLGKLKNLSTLN